MLAELTGSEALPSLGYFSATDRSAFAALVMARTNSFVSRRSFAHLMHATQCSPKATASSATNAPMMYASATSSGSAGQRLGVGTTIHIYHSGAPYFNQIYIATVLLPYRRYWLADASRTWRQLNAGGRGSGE